MSPEQKALTEATMLLRKMGRTRAKKLAYREAAMMLGFGDLTQTEARRALVHWHAIIPVLEALARK